MLMLLGTGPWQRSLYDLLQKTTCEICTISPESAGFGASKHIVADVRDTDKIISEIKRLHLNPSYFLSSQTDLTVKSVAYLNSFYGVGREQVSVANIFTHKVLMRDRVSRLCSYLKNPSYKGVMVNDLADDVIECFVSDLDGFVIKPASLQSSLGVKYVKNGEYFNLTEYLRSISSFGCSELIIEGFLNGTEYTVEGYKYKDGTHVVHAVSSKEKKFGFGIANALHYSNDALINCLKVQSDLEKLFHDYDFGPTHTELIKNENDEFYLVEAAIRGGGSGIPSVVVPSLTGFYPEQQMLVDIGLISSFRRESKVYDFVSLIFFEFKDTVATNINTDNIKENLIKLWCDYVGGDAVRPITDDRSRHGFFIIGSNTKDELVSILKKLECCNSGIQLHV